MEGILAHGGSSRVWAIVSPDGTPLAFKELTLQDAGAEKVFLRETAVLRHLRHPAIVPIQDVLMTETHTGVVLPRALGSLADWVERKGPMPPRLATRCILTALSGLQYAHEEGILHRDLKPGNILVFPDEQVQLCDFGAALDLDTPEATTSTGVVLGTLPYLAPERRRGRDATVASDLYGMGATLAHLLTGIPPGDLYAEESLREMKDRVPAALMEVIRTAGSHRPTGRYSSAEAMTEALRQAQASLPFSEMTLALQTTAPQPVSPGDTIPVPVSARRSVRKTRTGGIPWIPALTLLGVLSLLVLLVSERSSGEVDGSTASTAEAGTTLPFPPCPDGIARLIAVTGPGPNESLGGAFGDFNGDGKVDAAFTSLQGETVSLYLNLTSNGLGPALEFPSHRSTIRPAMGNFNGDQQDDLLVVHSDDSGYQIFLGSSDKGLQPKRTLFHGRPPDHIGIADWNGDGLSDLLLADIPSDCLGVRSQRPDGSFSPTQCVIPAFPDQAVFGDSPPRFYGYDRTTYQLWQWTSHSGGEPEAEEVWNSGYSRPEFFLVGTHRLPDSPPQLYGAWMEGNTVSLIRFQKDRESWAGCVDSVFTGNPLRVSDVSDLNGDGRADFLGTRTCAGCSSNHVILMSRPPLP